MKTPPINTALLSSLLDLTVINLTTNCGWDNTPIPTPSIRLDTRVHQNGLPSAGIDVHPVKPVVTAAAVALCGTMFTRFERAILELITPPNIQ